MKPLRLDPEAEKLLRRESVRTLQAVSRAAAFTSLARCKPEQLAPEALHGITGDFVQQVMPHTESGMAALLVQFLVAAGVYLGRTAYYPVEGSRHYPNLFAVVAGDTSKGRKGTSWGQTSRVLTLADEQFAAKNITSGLSSGEGLIWAVRDEIREQHPVKTNGRTVEYEEVISDAGILDKRLLIVEPEFARALKVADRDGNTLSAIIRESWDSGNLRVLTRAKPARATGAHIGIVAHITSDELRRLLTTTEAANGFANRFLWLHSERSKELPFGGSLADADLLPLARKLREIRKHAETAGRTQFDSDARADWVRVYGPLSSGKGGLLGAVIARAEAQVVRLALLYALLDCDTAIRRAHLAAALAVWNYAEASARYIFGERLGDDTADTILGHLRSVRAAGLTRTEISQRFGKHKSAQEITRALDALAGVNLARVAWEHPETGRPVERWFSCEKSEISEISPPGLGVSSLTSLISHLPQENGGEE